MILEQLKKKLYVKNKGKKLYLAQYIYFKQVLLLLQK